MHFYCEQQRFPLIYLALVWKKKKKKDVVRLSCKVCVHKCVLLFFGFCFWNFEDFVLKLGNAAVASPLETNENWTDERGGLCQGVHLH